MYSRSEQTYLISGGQNTFQRAGGGDKNKDHWHRNLRLGQISIKGET